jgi:chromosome segregation ATPase
MADIKATSFRISEEDLEKFKVFTNDNGLNQAEAFKSIMQTVEMAKAKNLIKDRAKEVEVFQDTINNLMSYFLNSLNVNQSSEERIREELSKELQTKDNTISTMYEQLQELKADKINSDNTIKDISNKNKELQEQLQKANNDNIDKNKSIDKLNSNNDLLQESLQEYKQYKDNYKVLEKEWEQLKVDKTTSGNTINQLNNDNKQLNDKIKNDSDMIDFYKNNISELKTNIDTYKIDIKELERKYNQEVTNIKADHVRALQEQQKALHEQMKDKYDIEVAKKDLEFQKLNNEIEQLKVKKVKPVTNKPNN